MYINESPLFQIHAVEAVLCGIGNGEQLTDLPRMCTVLVWSGGASQCFISQPAELAWQKIGVQSVARSVDCVRPQLATGHS